MKHVAAVTLLLACFPHDSFSFFWKSRLIISTIDPDPSWDPEMLEWCAKQRQWRKDVSAGKITGFHNEGFYTKSASEIQWGLECREKYVQEATEYNEYKERMYGYVENVFLQTINILGHKGSRFVNQIRTVKDWIMARIFLRDPKAIKSMLNLVKSRKFHNMRDQEYINERWSELWKDIKFYKSMMERLTKVYLKYHYPDGYIRTRINDWLGIKNEAREAALKQRTTLKTKATTTKIYNEDFVLDYMAHVRGFDEQSKKKKK